MKKHIDEIQSPKVSIITPTFNSERFISATISSVINQTYKHWELIIVDDCSTDKTIHCIEPFLNSTFHIKLIKNPINQGAAISRNNAINAAIGDYIAFLDSDDLWKPEKLEKQIKFMQENNCDVCFSSYEKIDEFGNPLNKLVLALPELTYNKLLKSNYIGNLTGIYNVNALGKITTPNFRKRQDWILWLLVLKKSSKPAFGIQESLAYYRIRGNSMSSNKFNLLKYNFLVYRNGLNFILLKSIYYMIVFLLEHFFVKSKQEVSIL